MICVGGTFEYLHKGHRKLLDRAFSLGGRVCLGLTTDEFANKTRGRAVIPYEKRKSGLEEYLCGKGYREYRILPLEDRYGDALDEECTDIVVSEETYETALEINKIREKKGLAPMKIHVVPYVLAEDFYPISSTRIADGEIDAEGHLRRLLRVNVGSENPNKIAAVREVLSELYADIEIKSIETHTGVPEQPFDGDTIVGAINRAKSAIEDADLGIGIEAGLFWNDFEKKYFDVQYCAIVDKRGKITTGHGPGFRYPDIVIEHVKKGMSISGAMREVFGVEDIGYREGAIGFLTEGRYDRKELTKVAVLMAFIPRIKRDIYKI